MFTIIQGEVIFLTNDDLFNIRLANDLAHIIDDEKLDNAMARQAWKDITDEFEERFGMDMVCHFILCPESI